MWKYEIPHSKYVIAETQKTTCKIILTRHERTQNQFKIMPELTTPQLAVLNVIRDYIKAHGYPPSLTDIAAASGDIQVNAVRNFLIALEKKGYIERDEGVARGIRLVKETTPTTQAGS